MHPPDANYEFSTDDSTLGRDTATTCVANNLPEFTDENPPLLNPLTDAIIQDDPDSLIDTYEELKTMSDRIYSVQVMIRRRLQEKTVGQTDAKTRRVAGNRRRAVLEMPSESWDQSILKEAWNSFPDLRDECLKISEIGVKLREYKKLVGTSGVAKLETFRDMVKAAQRPPSGVATVKIEK